MKTRLMKLIPLIRQGVSTLSLQTGPLVLVFACLLSFMAIWIGSTGPSRQVAAQEMPTPTMDSMSLPEDVRIWKATVEQSRASLPATVADFNDLVALLSPESAPSTAIPTLGASDTMSHSVYLPLVVNGEPVPPRPLGSVGVLSGPAPCDGEICYDIQVSCPQLAQSADATLRVGDPQGTPQGTIFFASGWDGTYWWGYPGSNYESIVNQLQASGYRTVQIKWHTNWWAGTWGELEGDAKLACRPATVLRWVYDNLHQDVGAPFCAEGHSNGASQVAYAITQYGLADLFSLVLFESGPNFARIDHGCIEDTSDPTNQALFWNTSNERGLINWSLGLSRNSGACVDQDIAFLDNFEEASLAFDRNWQYRYPDTMAAFVFGENDLSTTAVHGLYYHNRVVGTGSPLVSMSVVAGTDHFVGETQQGMDAILHTLIDNCISQ